MNQDDTSSDGATRKVPPRVGETSSDSDGVRIVDRDEAEAAIDTGRVISRSNKPVLPTSAVDGEPFTSLRFPLPAGNTAGPVLARPRVAAVPVANIVSADGTKILDLRAAERR